MRKMYGKRRLLAFLLTIALVFGEGSIVYASEAGEGNTESSVVAEIQEGENAEEEQETVSPQATNAPEEAKEDEADKTPSPDVTEVPEESPAESQEADVTPEPITPPEASETPDATTAPEETATPEETQTPEETAAPGETQTPDASAVPSKSPVESPMESPTVSPTPSETPSATPEVELLFSGLSEEYSLSSTDMEAKQSLSEHTGELGSFAEGTDYVENEILVEAETEELAKVYAEAFDGTLKEYSGQVAVITLNADKSKARVTVADAVLASADESMRLPAAWPNYYYYLDTVDGEIIDEQAVDAVDLEGEGFEEEEPVIDEGEAELDVKYTDPYLSEKSGYYQWHHAAIGSREAWNANITGKNVKVAVIDSGLYPGHSDVTGTQINAGYGTGDDNGHGTHVAGIIAAKGNNNAGGVGVAPGVTLITIRVCDASGSMPTSAIMVGFDKAVNQGANIINMSLGGTGYSGPFQNKISAAYKNGIAVFCAAGNDASNSAHYPAAYKNAIGVAAVDKDNYLASFSNYGSYVRYSAPGADIYSTYKGAAGSFTAMSGTSQATPVVSGIAALLLSSGKVQGSGNKKVDNLLKLMDSGCVKAGGSGTGKGVVNLPKALGLSSVTTKPKNPVIFTKAGTYIAPSIKVSIGAENGMAIYYSTDGKSITYKNGKLSSNAKEYKGAFDISGSGTITVKAIAINKTNGLASKVVSAKYSLKPPVSGITIQSPTNVYTVAQGKSLKLEATVTPTYAKDKSLKWTIDGNPAGITVSGGTVKASAKAAPGTYKVRATAKNTKGEYKGVSVTCNVTVVAAANPVTVIKANPARVSVANGKTASITITVAKKDGKAGSAQTDVTWTSSNAKIATVAASGNGLTITGKSAGKVNIIGMAKDGAGKKISIPVTVTQPATSISVSGYTTLAAGKSITLTATVGPSNAANKKVKWSMVTKTKDVTVSGGKVTAKATAAAGNYVVRAASVENPSVYKNYTVTVTAGKLTSLKIKKSVEIFRVSNIYGAPTSASIPLTLEGANADKWVVESSNPNIVTVTKKSGSIEVKATGKVTGSSTITVKSTDGSNLKATCKVTVSNPVTKLHLSPEKNRSDFLARGKTLKLTPTFETAYGAVSSKAKKLKWTSSNPKYATVDAKGKVKALSNGSTGYQEVTIKAEATDGSKTYASYKITLCDPTTAMHLYGDKKANYDLISCNSNSATWYPIIAYKGNVSSKSPSYEYGVTVNKKGLSATFGIQQISGSNYYCLGLTGNTKGTYKVTLYCRDGSSAKRKYTIVVY